MLEKSFGLLYFLKKSRKKTKERYVYIRITVDGTSREISTKRKWLPERWNQSVGRATGTKEDVRSLNAYLDSLTEKVYQAKMSLIELGMPITAENLKNVLLSKGETKKLILEIFRSHNRQMETLVGRDYAPGTLERYRTSYDHTKAFIQWKYNVDDLNIRDLNYELISDYEYWLKSIRQCSHNTSMKYLGNFKKIVLLCVRKGWLKYDPFIGFKLAKKEVVRVPLTQGEVDKIDEKVFGSERVNIVKDIFLFSCYTGLAYIDVKKLKRSQIVTGVDGEKWITSNRQKTDTPINIPLLPKAIEIVDRYNHHPKCQNAGVVLPVSSNQKMNEYLKEIADLCGISKRLTFHIARHTFATTITLTNGVPIETVSKMLGHKSLKQTQHYAKIVDTKISQDMQVLKEKLSKASL
jgi:site-specific recombinase XerD